LQDAVGALEKWDGRLVTNLPAYPFARSVLEVLLEQTTNENSFFAQYGNQWSQYGGSWNGLNGILRDLMKEYRVSGKTPADPAVRQWLQSTFRKGVQLAKASQQHQPPITHRMPYQNNMGQWGSLAPQFDLVSPPLICPVTQTIWSQAGETFVQIVDLADVDRSLSLLPPGLSEDPTSPHANDQIPLWAAGKMHPAPLSRPAVNAVSESVRKLKRP
jgi:penicillin amidase